MPCGDWFRGRYSSTSRPASHTSDYWHPEATPYSTWRMAWRNAFSSARACTSITCLQRPLAPLLLVNASFLYSSQHTLSKINDTGVGGALLIDGGRQRAISSHQVQRKKIVWYVDNTNITVMGQNFESGKYSLFIDLLDPTSRVSFPMGNGYRIT